MQQDLSPMVPGWLYSGVRVPRHEVPQDELFFAVRRFVMHGKGDLEAMVT